MNYYDKEEFDVESILKTSVGARLSKRGLIAGNVLKVIFIIVSLVFLLVIYPYWYKNFERIFPVFFLIAVVLLYKGVMVLINYWLSWRASGLTDEEKYYFNLYTYHNLPSWKKGLHNTFLNHFARFDAISGEKERCKCALDMIGEEYNHPDLEVLREWIDSDELSLSRERLAEVEKPNKWKVFLNSIIFIVLAYGTAFMGIDYTRIPYDSLTSKLIIVSGILTAVTFGLYWTAIVSAIIARITKIKIKSRKIYFAIFMCATVIVCATASKDIIVWGMGADAFHQNVDIIEYTQENIGVNFDADGYTPKEYYKYNDEVLYLTNMDIEVTNFKVAFKMCDIAAYLTQNGTISSYVGTIKLQENPNGIYKALLGKDGTDAYILYYNGGKVSQYGKEYMEFVLLREAESESTLVGFYEISLQGNDILE